MVLPEMGHFMHERRKRLGRRAVGEVGRVEGDFVGDFLRVGDAGEAVAGEVAVGSLVPLHGDQAGRELAREQLAVEMVVGGVEAGVGAVRRVVGHGGVLVFVSYDTILGVEVKATGVIGCDFLVAETDDVGAMLGQRGGRAVGGKPAGRIRRRGRHSRP